MDDTQLSNESFDSAMQECEKFEAVIIDELGKLPIASERSQLAILFLSIALDHFRAIMHLLDDGRYTGSAFALARPITDAVFRAIWVAPLATDDEIRARLTNEKAEYPSPKKVSYLMKLKFNLDNDVFSETVKDDYGVLCGYVHTGLRQLKGKAAISRTKSFPYKNALTMLMRSSTYLWLGSCYFATSIRKAETAVRIDKAHDYLCEKIGYPIADTPRWVN